VVSEKFMAAVDYSADSWRVNAWQSGDEKLLQSGGYICVAKFATSGVASTTSTCPSATFAWQVSCFL
jgi:hypothetical protein